MVEGNSIEALINSEMKISIVLVLVALTGLLDQAIGEEYREYHPTETLPVDSLLEKLGARMTEDTTISVPTRAFYGKYVYGLL